MGVLCEGLCIRLCTHLCMCCHSSYVYYLCFDEQYVVNYGCIVTKPTLLNFILKLCIIFYTIIQYASVITGCYIFKSNYRKMGAGSESSQKVSSNAGTSNWVNQDTVGC